MKNLYKLILSTTIPLALLACSSADGQTQINSVSEPSLSSGNYDTMVVAGGCFWCVESDFEKLDGVIEAVSGYSGGVTENPTYKEVTYKDTGHYEVAEITFDPSVVSYDKLLAYYWTTVDPTDPTGQFCDKGDSYRTAIFARPDQIDRAKASLETIKETKPFEATIVTPVLQAGKFYKAEEYHQDYYKKNPLKYKYYRTGCGRDGTLKRLWKK